MIFLKCDAFYHIEYKYMHEIVCERFSKKKKKKKKKYCVNECEINIFVRKHASLSLSRVCQ